MRPPVGLELFVLSGIVKEDMATIARNVLPFIFMGGVGVREALGSDLIFQNVSNTL